MPSAEDEKEVFDHLEEALGETEGGARAHAGGFEFKILEFSDQPCEDARTWCTVGLSRLVLPQLHGDAVRQELMFCCYDRFRRLGPGDIVHVVAEDLVAAGKALVRGEVVGPRGPLFGGCEVEAVYCTFPVLHARLEILSSIQPPVVFVWLVPITAPEAAYAREHGWNAFEDLLESDGVDLLDLGRVGIV